jgi:tight adherence protein C
MLLVLAAAAAAFGGAIFVLAQNAPAAARRRFLVATVNRWSPDQGVLRRRRGRMLVRTADAIGRRLTSHEAAQNIADRLSLAGLSGRVTVESFVALRLGLVVVGTLGGLSLAAIAGTSPGVTLVFTAVVGISAYFVPGFALGRRAVARRAQIEATLPDVLDMLAVTVEAGLGLYGAIARLVETTTGPLADELALVLTELRIGESSERALKRMAARVGSNEVGSVIRTLVQGEQLGISLAGNLRNLGTDARRRRRAIAEEQAAKAPVKMMFPAALFIFPALFIVMLGPAVLEIKKYL